MAIDISAFLSALMFCVSNVLGMVLISKYQARDHFDYHKLKDLDPEFIQEEFEFRREHRPLEISAAIINSIAWFSLVAPMFQVAWILSHGGTRRLSAHSIVCSLAIGGSMAEFLSTLMFIGTETTAEWITKDFNLDNWNSSSSNDQIGWRSLEVAFMLSRGTRLWVDAIEWMFLYTIMTILFVSNHTSPTRLFSSRWAGLGLVAAALCVVDFAADVLRFQDWRTFSKVARITSLILRVFVLPIWLLGLSMMLPAAQEKAGLLFQPPVVVNKEVEQGDEASDLVQEVQTEEKIPAETTEMS